MTVLLRRIYGQTIFDNMVKKRDFLEIWTYQNLQRIGLIFLELIFHQIFVGTYLYLYVRLGIEIEY